MADYTLSTGPLDFPKTGKWQGSDIVLTDKQTLEYVPTEVIYTYDINVNTWTGEITGAPDQPITPIPGFPSEIPGTIPNASIGQYTATNDLEISLDNTTFTNTIPVDSAQNIYVRWKSTSLDKAHNTTISGDVLYEVDGNLVSQSSAGYVLRRIPTNDMSESQSDVGLGSETEFSVVLPTGYGESGESTFVYGTSDDTGAMIATNGAAYVSLPTDTSTNIKLLKGNTIQIKHTNKSGASEETKTTITFTDKLGNTASKGEFTSETVGVLPAIGTPTIKNVVRGATDLVPDVILGSSAYAPENDPGPHASSEWEVYEADLASLETSVITGVDETSITYATGSSAVNGVMPNGGTPYVIDVTPADAQISNNNADISKAFAGKVGAGINLSTHIYMSAPGSPSSLKFDLREYSTNVSSVRIFCGRNTGGYVGYSMRLLDSGKNPIAGTEVVCRDAGTDGYMDWQSIPVLETPRYIEFFHANAGLQYRMGWTGIEVNGEVLINDEDRTTLTLKNDTDLDKFAPGTEVVQNSAGTPETSAITGVAQTADPSTYAARGTGSLIGSWDFSGDTPVPAVALPTWASVVATEYTGTVGVQPSAFGLAGASQDVHYYKLDSPGVVAFVRYPTSIPDEMYVIFYSNDGITWIYDKLGTERAAAAGITKYPSIEVYGSVAAVYWAISRTLTSNFTTKSTNSVITATVGYNYGIGDGVILTTLSLTDDTNLANLRVGDSVSLTGTLGMVIAAGSNVSNGAGTIAAFNAEPGETVGDENGTDNIPYFNFSAMPTGTITWTGANVGTTLTYRVGVLAPTTFTTSGNISDPSSFSVPTGTIGYDNAFSFTFTPNAASGSLTVAQAAQTGLYIYGRGPTGIVGTISNIVSNPDPTKDNFLDLITVTGDWTGSTSTVTGPDIDAATGTVASTLNNTMTLSESDGRWLVTHDDYQGDKKLNKTVTDPSELGAPGAPGDSIDTNVYTLVTVPGDQIEEVLDLGNPPDANKNSSEITLTENEISVSKAYYSRVKYSDDGSTGSTVSSQYSDYHEFMTADSFVPNTGDAYGGGYFAGQINDGGTVYNLIVAPSSYDQFQKWRSGNVDDGSVPNNEVYGATAMVALGAVGAAYPAFNWCINDATGPNAGTYDTSNATGTGEGGFNDWYIPAVNELEICYYNLKPSTTNNITNTGINPNSVPARALNYTTNDPSQTTGTLFQAGGAQAFSTGASYWTATQVSGVPTNAYRIEFGDGTLGISVKDSATFVRPMRRETA